MVLPISQSFTLPELPQPLTHLSPYVQRALELKTKDPIMCYWCLYFSAKHGVAAKGGKECRPFLFDLMDTLEKLKQELKSNDAIATDEAGSAYIENFALKVFNLADNEDRKGKASRSTAKKFLAAANFLELLTIFDVGDQSENEEKIRYSKWKAADIAKAFREGRQPTPGPAGSSFRDMQPSASGAVSPSQQHESLSVFGSIPPSISASPIRASLLPLPSSPNSRPQPLPSPSDLTPISSPPSRTVPLHNVSPPSVSPERTTAAHNNTHDSNDIPHTPTPTTKSSNRSPPNLTPGGWSSTATPGNDEPRWVSSTSTPETGAPAVTMIGRGSTGGFSGRAVSPSPADRRLGGAPFIPEPRQQYEVQEVDHDDGDVDAYDIKTPVQARPSTSVIHSKNERVDSWSSTAAIRGDAPSRSSSLGATTWSDEPDSIENLRIKLPLSRQPTVSAVTEAQTRLNSNTLPSNAGDTNEASDALGPLPSTSSASTNKRVHFTPSVVGGLSSIASSSPPPSPSSVADIPLPPSTDSDASDDTSRVTVTVGMSQPSQPWRDQDHVEHRPSMSYVLPNGAANIHTGSSLVAGSSAEITPAATARLPPPPIPSVPNGSTSSGSASGGLQARPGTGNGLGNVNGLTSANPRANRPTLPSAPSPSPRQGTAPIPPISAILPEIPPPPRTAHLDFPSVPTDRASNSTSLQGPIHPNPGLPPVPLAPFYPPTPYPRLPTLPDSIAPEDNARAKKHAKFAMSALDYDDLSTARRELVWALAVLGVDVAL